MDLSAFRPMQQSKSVFCRVSHTFRIRPDLNRLTIALTIGFSFMVGRIAGLSIKVNNNLVVNGYRSARA